MTCEQTRAPISLPLGPVASPVHPLCTSVTHQSLATADLSFYMLAACRATRFVKHDRQALLSNTSVATLRHHHVTCVSPNTTNKTFLKHIRCKHSDISTSLVSHLLSLPRDARNLLVRRRCYSLRCRRLVDGKRPLGSWLWSRPCPFRLQHTLGVSLGLAHLEPLCEHTGLGGCWSGFWQSSKIMLKRYDPVSIKVLVSEGCWDGQVSVTVSLVALVDSKDVWQPRASGV